MRVIKYNIDDFQGIKCMNDFYALIGISNELGTVIRSVAQIRMCYEDCDKLLQFILKNVPRSEKRNFIKWDIPYRVDWLDLSPKVDDRLPSGELQIDDKW